MNRKEIEFDGEDLVQTVESLAKHLTGKSKVTFRTARPVPSRAKKAITPAQILSRRKRDGQSPSVAA